MIYTLTVAPCIDYSMNIGDNTIKTGCTNRVDADGLSLGGKGINVGNMLNNIKVTNIPLIAVGKGRIGIQIKDMVNETYDDAVFLNTVSDSRMNVMITGPHEDTRFNAKAPKLTEAGHEKIFKYFKKHLKKNDIVVLAGSVGKEGNDLYAKIMKECVNPAGAFAIVDSTGEALTLALEQHPFMIKPNDEELGDLVGRVLKTDEEIIEAGLEFQKKGPKTVLVTLGRRGAYYFAEDGHVYHCHNAVGTQVSAVGAGDSSIAGFIKGLAEKKSIEKRLQYSMAAGGATAFSPHLGSNKLFKSLVPTIKVEVVR